MDLLMEKAMEDA